MKHAKNYDLIVSESVSNFMCSNHITSNRNNSDGFFYAGKGDDGRWYSNTAYGMGVLSDIICETERYSPLLDYLRNNKDSVKAIPWFSFSGDFFKDRPDSFIERILSAFGEVIKMGRYFRDGRNYSAIDYIRGVERSGTVHPISRPFSYMVLGINDFDMKAYGNIDEILDNWIKIRKSIWEKDRSLRIPVQYDV